MEFFNSKRRGFKALHAPNGPLTVDERNRCEKLAEEAWAEVDAEEQGCWETRHFAANIGRQARAAVARDGEANQGDRANEHRGLWGLSQAKNELAPTDVLKKHGLLDRGSRAQNARVWQDEGLIVRGGYGSHC